MTQSAPKTPSAQSAPHAIEYRTLKLEDIRRELFHGFIRHQLITRSWKKVDGKWRVDVEPSW